MMRLSKSVFRDAIIVKLYLSVFPRIHSLTFLSAVIFQLLSDYHIYIYLSETLNEKY